MSDLALVMKGGGIKGLAYVGAIEELSKYYSFNRYVGTSAGAISAILLAAGFSTEELQEELSQKDFSDFKDASIIKGIWNFFFKKGIYEAHTFTTWLDILLAKKLNTPYCVRLADLPNRVTVYASRRGKKAIIFDSKSPETKNKRAAFVARCSMSIPFIFTPEKSEGLRVFDGGVQHNYPIDILMSNEPNLEFIGLYLGSKIFEGDSRKGILNELLSIWTEANDEENLRRYNDKTIIIDPRPISTLQLNLTKKEKKFLLDSGRIAAKQFLVKKGILEQGKILETEIFNLQKLKAEILKEKKKRQKKFIFYIFLLTIIILSISFIYCKHSNHNIQKPIQSINTGKDIKNCIPQTNKYQIRIANFGKNDLGESISQIMNIQITSQNYPDSYIGLDTYEDVLKIGSVKSDSVLNTLNTLNCNGVKYTGLFVYGHYFEKKDILVSRVNLINLKDSIFSYEKNSENLQISLQTPKHLDLNDKVQYITDFIIALLDYYSGGKRLEKAENYFLKTLTDKSINNPKLSSYCNYFLGNIFLLKKEYENANFFYSKSESSLGEEMISEIEKIKSFIKKTTDPTIGNLYSDSISDYSTQALVIDSGKLQNDTISTFSKEKLSSTTNDKNHKKTNISKSFNKDEGYNSCSFGINKNYTCFKEGDVVTVDEWLFVPREYRKDIIINLRLVPLQYNTKWLYRIRWEYTEAFQNELCKEIDSVRLHNLKEETRILPITYNNTVDNEETIVCGTPNLTQSDITWLQSCEITKIEFLIQRNHKLNTCNLYGNVLWKKRKEFKKLISCLPFHLSENFKGNK